MKKDGTWGYIDKKGKEVIPCIYDSASGFYEGLAAVKNYGKLIYIDKSGKEKISCEYYSSIGDFHEGLARVQRNGKWGYIDKYGNKLKNIGGNIKNLINETKKNNKKKLKKSIH